MSDFRTEADGMGRIDVPADKLWGAQTQRSLQHFSIGRDLIPREMIAAYAIIKRAAATANHRDGRMPDQVYALITRVCDEIFAGGHHDKKISEYVHQSLMLVTALAPVIGYDKASAIAHFAAEKDPTLKEAALQLGHVDEATFDRVVDPAKMVRPYVANKADHDVRVADTVEIAQMEQTR